MRELITYTSKKIAGTLTCLQIKTKIDILGNLYMYAHILTQTINPEDIIRKVTARDGRPLMC